VTGSGAGRVAGSEASGGAAVTLCTVRPDLAGGVAPEMHGARYRGRMRVGLVSPYSLTLPGGVQVQILGLARAMAKRGVAVRVLGPCDGPPPETFVTPLGDSIPTAANGSVAPLAPDPACSLRTIAALRSEEFDVLNVHEPLAPGPSLIATVLHPAPIVGTFHAAGRSSSYRYLGRGTRYYSQRLDARVAVSPDAAALARTGIEGDFLTWFNGIEVERFAHAEPYPSTHQSIFFLGRHEERKGLAVLLDAFRRIDDDVELWIGGDGPQTVELKRLHATDRRISWLGRISDAERNSRMRGATVFCAPSLGGESFGVVLLEAMAAGTVVVASDLPGYRNAATPDVNALMSPPDDPIALAKTLRQVLRDEALALRLEAAGRLRADELSMDRLADRYIQLFRHLMAAEPARRAAEMSTSHDDDSPKVRP
jgi:phosphatidyl-myo-inositol alpha-mannosyltransferase